MASLDQLWTPVSSRHGEMEPTVIIELLSQLMWHNWVTAKV